MSLQCDGSTTIGSIALPTTLSAFPCGFAAFIKPANVAHTGTIIGVGNTASPLAYFNLEIVNTTVRAMQDNAVSASTGAVLSAGSWQLVMASFASSTSRAAWGNGSKATNSTSRALQASIASMRVGAATLSGVNQRFFNGKIAWAAAWLGYAPTDADEAFLRALGNPRALANPPSHLLDLAENGGNLIAPWLPLTVSGGSYDAADNPAVAAWPPSSSPPGARIFTGGF